MGGVQHGARLSRGMTVHVRTLKVMTVRIHRKYANLELLFCYGYLETAFDPTYVRRAGSKDVREPSNRVVPRGNDSELQTGNR